MLFYLLSLSNEKWWTYGSEGEKKNPFWSFIVQNEQPVSGKATGGAGGCSQIQYVCQVVSV